MMRDTTRQLKKLNKEFESICFYCESKVTFRASTRDHFWPKSLRGWNGITNQVLCCQRCNTDKGNRYPTLAEFYKLLSHRPNTSVDDLQEPPLEQLPPHLRDAFIERDRLRAERALLGAEKVAAKKVQVENRRQFLLYSNMAGPFYACASLGGSVRGYRGESFPFKPIEFLKIELTN